MARRRKFGDFLEALTAKPPAGPPCITIGGQAVNFWAEQSEGLVPVIRRFLPYSSRDLDLVAEQKSQVDAIKAVVNLKCTEAEQGYSGIDRAAFQTRKGETVIQVLASMYSVSIGDLRKHTRELKFDVAGRTVDVRVADLSVLLKDKIELSLASDSIRNRHDKKNDRRHLKMLILCVQARLRHHYILTLEGKAKERDLINQLKEYQGILFSAKAREVSQLDRTVKWSKAIPKEFHHLERSGLLKVAAYFSGNIAPRLASSERVA